MNAEMLTAAVGLQFPVALAWLPQITATFDRFGIVDIKEQAMFLAQTAHESAGFKRLEENLNYSAPALLSTFHKYFLDLSEAEQYARRPEKIANRVYANRMGNGDEASGDGWLFRGRGLIETSGRLNYRAFGNFIHMDMEGNPERLQIPRYAALSAGFFWSTNSCAGPARTGDVRTVTHIINGGLNGLDDRKNRYETALAALENRNGAR
jgi:putative chitinase